MSLLSAIFGNYSQKEIKRIMPLQQKVLSLEEEYRSLSNEELRAKTDEFKNRLTTGETLDDILPEAFAVCREAGDRVLGMRHFPVQIIGGIILHQGRIAEMKTGEGKTLVATLPAYLNALSGKGVHIVTVNDYLAKRDSEWMGKLYRFLGLSVGLIIHGMSHDEKKKAYDADITYCTNNELGFDYLRDNMVIYKEQKVQREHNFAIVDEVDSILIDEARTPLIISGQSDKSTDLYSAANAFARTLKMVKVKEMDDKASDEDTNYDGDYVVDEKAHTATLTPEGVKKAESYFNIENLNDTENIAIAHHVNQAIRAHGIMKRDVDYVVKDGEVIIVDEFTGRLMYGRRYNEGLHQAIEAKEGVKVARESKTLATITFQNFFRLYNKLSGMMGTAMTEEAEIIAQAGKFGAVTIATNMAGRGTDIMLGGNAEYLAKAALRHDGLSEEMIIEATGFAETEDPDILNSRAKYKEYYDKFKAEIAPEADRVREVGGLAIIGTERHDSRRIDNQLRGRAGRQGDPGNTQFFVSLEDDLMRLFGGERISTMMDTLKVEEDMPLESGMLSKTIEGAQKKKEGMNFAIRKNVLQYDDVMNKQRELIYSQRNKVLDGEDIKDTVYNMIDETIDVYCGIYLADDAVHDNWDLNGLREYFLGWVTTPEDLRFNSEELGNISRDEVAASLKEKAHARYAQREAEFGSEIMREMERVMLLRSVDTNWMDHIDAMDQLRQGIGLRAYGQHDPVVEYRNDSYDMFEAKTNAIREQTSKLVLSVRIKKNEEVKREKVAEETNTGDNKPLTVRGKGVVSKNALCPCGSGKKYKRCCGKDID